MSFSYRHLLAGLAYAMVLAAAGQDDVAAAPATAAVPRWSGALNADNDGTGSSGRDRLGLLLRGADLLGPNQLASMQYTAASAAPGRTELAGAGYRLPLAGTGATLDLYAIYAGVDSGSVTAGAIDQAIGGKGTLYGARYSRSLAADEGAAAWLAYGFDYKAYKANALVPGQQLNTDVTVHPFSVSYLRSWSLPGTAASATLTLLRNIAGGSNGSQDDFSRARAGGATANYNIVRLAASLTRALPSDWQVRAAVNGQYTRDALVPGEQFGAGGAASVRGFDERVVAEDSGVAANLELYTPNLCPDGWSCRALAFYDSAYLKRNSVQAGELSSTTIGSAGLGLRLQLSRQLNLQLDYGHVLRAGATDSGDANRLHLRLNLAY